MNKKRHDELLAKAKHIEVLQSAVAAGFKENQPVLLNAVTELVLELIRDIKPTA